MAKKTVKSKGKSKGEWQSELIKKWKQSEHIEWRASKNTSPEGDEFIGVRKWILRSDGSEIPDARNAITFKLDEDAPKALKRMRKLFTSLIESIEGE